MNCRAAWKACGPPKCARVEGIVLSRNYTEGGEVKAGQVLFRIDPAPYQAQLASAKAQLERAEANAVSARQKAERYKPLVAANAVSKQEFDDAVAAAGQANADIAAAKAAVTTAQINLGYTTVTAPISGRVGRALVTEGPVIALHSVVFPMPLRPTTARMPRSRVSDTSCSAWARP